MEDPVVAVAESIVNYIRKEDLDGLLKNLNMSESEWRLELRYEFDLEKMMETLFRSDILIPKLIMCDIQTISAFHYSALRGVDAILERFILHYKIPVDMCVQSGSTALHFACFSGTLDTVTLLMEKFHADVNRKDRYGWTALHYASTEGHLPVIEYLVSKGADISARDKDGTTAAFRAQAYGHINIVSYFVQSSGDDDLLLVDESVSDFGSANTQQVYASVDVLREKKSNGASTNKLQSEYEITETTAALSSHGKDKVASLVRDQLHDVFRGDEDPYSKAVPDPTAGKTGLDIGLHTLTRILKDEFLKFKAEQEINQIGDNKSDTPDATYLQKADNFKPYTPVGDYYEDISKFGNIDSPKQNPISSEYEKCADSPVSSPPPLPPRHSGFDEISPRKESLGKKKSSDKLPKSKKKLDRVSYMTLRLEDLAKQAPAKTKALIVLNRFDHSNTVMEACFKALIQDIEGPEDWKKLANALPLRNRPDAVKRCIRNIETTNPSDIKRQALAVLQDWRHYFGEAANVDALIAAMKQCGLSDTVPGVETAALEFSA